MPIWTYDDSSVDKADIEDAVKAVTCRYCSEPLTRLHSLNESLADGVRHLEGSQLTREVRACCVCGWWFVREEAVSIQAGYGGIYRRGSAGVLRDLNLTDVNAPIEEVRAFLAARYDARFQVHPRRFEEVVASVFADLGYHARVTAYSGDDGVDVILDGPGGDLVGIQVKRYRNSISVEQIRSLAGALVLGGMTRGIFVTTSTYQSGAAPTADRFTHRGYPIELIDAPRFLDALKIAQRNAYRNRDEPSAPFADVRLVVFEEHQALT